MAKLTRGVNCAPGAVCWHNSEITTITPSTRPSHSPHNRHHLPLVPPLVLFLYPVVLSSSPGARSNAERPRVGLGAHLRRLPRPLARLDSNDFGARSDAERHNPARNGHDGKVARPPNEWRPYRGAAAMRTGRHGRNHDITTTRSRTLLGRTLVPSRPRLRPLLSSSLTARASLRCALAGAKQLQLRWRRRCPATPTRTRPL